MKFTRKHFSILTLCFTQLFGWNLKSLWQIANQKRCYAFLQMGRLAEAHQTYRYMIDTGDEATMHGCHDWCIGKYSIIVLATILTLIPLRF
jgi:hypothetical protein